MCRRITNVISGNVLSPLWETLPIRETRCSYLGLAILIHQRWHASKHSAISSHIRGAPPLSKEAVSEEAILLCLKRPFAAHPFAAVPIHKLRGLFILYMRTVWMYRGSVIRVGVSTL